MEHRLWLCLLAMRAHMKSNGTILDAGANNGRSAVQIASKFRNHTVLAIEPVRSNVVNILRLAQNLPNVRVAQVGLSNVTGGFDSYGASLDKMSTYGETGPQFGSILKYNLRQRNEQTRVFFNLTTIDSLLEESPSVAFLHLDLEGAELLALSGAVCTITKHRPLLSVESFPVSRKRQHLEVTNFLKFLKYEVYRVPESCGADDCFNSIAIPIELQIQIPSVCVCETCH